MHDDKLSLLIFSVDDPADGVRRYTLIDPKGKDLPDWEPGAHIDVEVEINNQKSLRQYSLCGLTSNKKQWQFAVRLDSSGRGGSSHIHKTFFEGSVVNVSKPRNNFPLMKAENYIFIAGGIGITPIIPMIEEVNRSGKNWNLIYCGRTINTMPFVHDLNMLYGFKVSIHESDMNGQFDLKGTLSHSENSEIYCCGPSSMIDELEKYSESVSPDHIHFERFNSKDEIQDVHNTEFEVNFSRSGITAVIPYDKSILDIAEELGIEVDSSCQEGVCGSCEVCVLEGEPDHRDSVLSPREKVEGKSMMICVSRSKKGRLILDI